MGGLLKNKFVLGIAIFVFGLSLGLNFATLFNKEEVRDELREIAYKPTFDEERVLAEVDDKGVEGELLVTKAIDGDTIVIEGGEVIRYIGIDTPENPNSSKKDCFAKEAYEKNVELVEGKYVRLVKDVSETDRYNRLLRYVYVGDIFVNNELVREGFAQAVSYPPDVAHQQLFQTSQREAFEENRGLWGGCY